MLKDSTLHKSDAARAVNERGFSDAVINSLPGIFYVFDETGHILLWNKNLERVTGYSAAEIALRTPLDYVPDEEHPLVADRIREAFEGGSADAEITLVSKSGTRTPFYVTGSRMLLDGTTCLVGMGIDVTRRKEAEQRLNRSRKQLRALAARIQKVREEERSRIAREIHDVLGQALTGMKIDLAWLAKKIGSSEKAVLLEKIRSLAELVDPTIQRVRKICTELRPGVLDDLGLVAAIEWQSDEFTARTGIQTRVRARDVAVVPGGERSTAVFRIFQEALTNIARHSGAKHVQIELGCGESGVELIVRDDGRGITSADLVRPESLGILGMQERAHVFGGEVRISGVQAEGTTVKVTVPHEPETPPAAEVSGRQKRRRE